MGVCIFVFCILVFIFYFWLNWSNCKWNMNENKYNCNRNLFVGDIFSFFIILLIYCDIFVLIVFLVVNFRMIYIYRNRGGYVCGI